MGSPTRRRGCSRTGSSPSAREYEKAPEPWASYVTVDGNLYTGQNPTSSRELAQRLVKDLG
ncbi:hypothetical protein [Corynebacterium afermentans]|uniref:hypothetical protein n=1 Tax=Corynebacterium afermentans TaxID=38286 RepID=UPI003743682F|nr:hypothetical protein CAFEL_07930 [Corynebacterium afermentans subsp. lipophilum]